LRLRAPLRAIEEYYEELESTQLKPLRAGVVERIGDQQ